MALDGSGNVVVAGAVQGTVNFGGGSLTSISYVDLFVAKYDGTGRHLWSRRVGSTDTSNTASGVAVDTKDNVLVTGSFTGTADFGGQSLTSAGGPDIFLVKYSTAGNRLWARRFGSAGTDRGYAVAVDTSDNVVVTGFFTGTADFGGGPLTSAGGADVFLAKYSPDGAHLWSKRFGGSSRDTALALAVAGSDIVLTGFFEGTANFGGSNLTSPVATDIFVARYAADGRHLWSTRAGGTSDATIQGAGVAVDGTGSVVVTGTFTSTADFGGGPLTSAGGADIFLVKYSAAGSHLWSERFGSTLTVSGDMAAGVAVDRPTGDVLLTGSIVGSMSFGGDILWQTNNYDVFVARFSGAGTHLWSTRATGSATGGPGHDHGMAITTDTTGNVLVTGDFVKLEDFGAGLLSSTGARDGFVVKFAP
jgi:uncharacterized protein (AIM24 family)